MSKRVTRAKKKIDELIKRFDVDMTTFLDGFLTGIEFIKPLNKTEHDEIANYIYLAISKNEWIKSGGGE
jgi:hypothetical protein